MLQNVWHNCSDRCMNPVYATAFGIAPLLMCLSYHLEQYDYKETELLMTKWKIYI